MQWISLRLETPDAWNCEPLDIKVSAPNDDAQGEHDGPSAAAHGKLLMKLYCEHQTITCSWMDVFCEAILQSDHDDDKFFKPLTDMCKQFRDRTGPFAPPSK
jgi:hypothetical protein